MTNLTPFGIARPLELDDCITLAIRALLEHGETVDAGHWQGIPTEGKPDLQTREIMNLSFSCPIPADVGDLANLTKPNLPWAEIEFLERVGREPHNPHHSLKDWPWWRGQSDQTMHDGLFSHTYSERFWPYARYEHKFESGVYTIDRPAGLRFGYGNLDDVIELLYKHPHTRQATLPIFFPEDTGARHGGRIPCTLHYHFMLRDDELHLWYAIRSCDAVRHFRDDLYMAMRLCQWVIEELEDRELRDTGPQRWVDVKPGNLFFTAYSFHVHAGDMHLLS